MEKRGVSYEDGGQWKRVAEEKGKMECEGKRVNSKGKGGKSIEGQRKEKKENRKRRGGGIIIIRKESAAEEKSL